MPAVPRYAVNVGAKAKKKAKNKEAKKIPLVFQLPKISMARTKKPVVLQNN